MAGKTKKPTRSVQGAAIVVGVILFAAWYLQLDPNRTASQQPETHMEKTQLDPTADKSVASQPSPLPPSREARAGAAGPLPAPATTGFLNRKSLLKRVRAIALSPQPQQTPEEMDVTLGVLESHPHGANFLVYGLGYDSAAWEAANAGGRTVFLEDSSVWIANITAALPWVEAHLVAYTKGQILKEREMMAKVRDLTPLWGKVDPACLPGTATHGAGCRELIHPSPSIKMGKDGAQSVAGVVKAVHGASSVDWDIIMIDAPMGWSEDASFYLPGRMQAVYTSLVTAHHILLSKGATKPHVDIMLHDMDRRVEDAWGTHVLCAKDNLVQHKGRMAHYRITKASAKKAAQSNSWC